MTKKRKLLIIIGSIIAGIIQILLIGLLLVAIISKSWFTKESFNQGDYDFSNQFWVYENTEYNYKLYLWYDSDPVPAKLEDADSNRIYYNNEKLMEFDFEWVDKKKSRFTDETYKELHWVGQIMFVDENTYTFDLTIQSMVATEDQSGMALYVINNSDFPGIVSEGYLEFKPGSYK